MNAVVYCRVSSKEQVEGTSLDSQESACREYAIRNRLEVKRVFVERGESAKFADRTQLLELMAFCGKRENGIERLLVWKVDRLARNVGDHFNIKAGLLKHNIRVVSVTEPIDGNPEGKLLETILAGFAQFDNDLRAARTLQGMRRKVQEGIFPWKPPLGYTGALQPGNKKTDPDKPDQPAFAILQSGWNEFATGRYTKMGILRWMTERGLRNDRGKPISKQNLDHIFKNVFYTGVLRDPWSGEEHTGQHLPMVTRETFAEVQRIVAGRTHAVAHHSLHPDFPLRSFVRCLSCELSLTGSFSRGRSMRYPYYHCYAKNCTQRGNYNLAAVHKEFTLFLNGLFPTAKSVDRIREYVAESATLIATDENALEKKRLYDLDRVTQQQQQLIRMKMDQLITDDEFVAQRSVLATRLVELGSPTLETERSLDEVMGDLDAICQPLMHLGDWWQDIDPERKRRFQRLLLPSGYVFSRVGTAQRGRLFSTFEAPHGSMSNGVPLDGHTWNQLMKEIEAFATILKE